MEKATLLTLDLNYSKFLQAIKERLRIAQLRVTNNINTEVINFYWQLGKDILYIQSTNTHWGSKFLQQLAHDLQQAHPGMSGFSTRSLEYMRLLASLYPARSFTQQAAAQLPWAHLQLLLDQFKADPIRREWYAKEAIANGWSHSTLNTHIKSSLYDQQSTSANKVSNYQKILPSTQSALALAQEILKNPYSFDFITISKQAHEREIEKELAKHIKDFLLELGASFVFIGTQVPIKIDGENYFIDVLFDHLKLRAFFVAQLKAKRFKLADLGPFSFYLAAVDHIFLHAQDNPTIGILLCGSRSKIIAKYALKNINAPIGVSEYKLSTDLPKNLKTSLPTIEEIEAELNEK